MRELLASEWAAVAGGCGSVKIEDDGSFTVTGCGKAQLTASIQDSYGLGGGGYGYYGPGGGGAWSKPLLDWLSNSIAAFERNFEAMVEANTIGADKYFHCKANCEASLNGPVGEATANVISNLRELTDAPKTIVLGRADDSSADQTANEFGRTAAPWAFHVDAPDNFCRAYCDGFRPVALDQKY